MIFGKNLAKLGIVLLSKNNIRLKFWNGGSICFPTLKARYASINM
jgi:hypothetical protein